MSALAYDGQIVRRAQSRFLDGYDLPDGLMPAGVQRSWERLRRSGATPGDRARFDRQSSTPRVAGTTGLLSAAMPEMEALHRSMNSPAWTVLCVDTAGTIIGSLCNQATAPAEIRDPLRVGRSVSEHNIGTNAPAIALVEREPIVVQRAEHFLVDLDNYVCAAAPIFGTDGALAGAIDVTGSTVNLQAALLDHVTMAARAIENRLFAQLDNANVVSLHYMPSFLGTVAEGLLAVGEDRTIVAVNDAACRMLSAAREQLIGRNIDEIFDRAALSTESDNPEIRTIFDRTGRRFFIRGKRERPTVTRVAMRSASLTNGIAATQAPPAGDPAVARAIESGCKAIARRLPLIIRGDTGSGKEVLARTVHNSQITNKPFVAVNCSAIPESLMEAELFGYADGAFTGARKGGAIGAVEQANGGTLFLDEIGDAPLALQAKLLRALQEGSISRLGSRREVKVDFTVISATHRDLKSMIAEGSFREDLFYRLNGLTVFLPALRERKDISDLIDKLLRDIAGDGAPAMLSDEARSALLAYRWPGNVRQLAQALAAAVALCDDLGNITLDDFPPDIRDELCEATPAIIASAEGSLVASQAEFIRRALLEANNNVSEAARRLKVSRTTIYNHLKRDQ